MTTPVYKIETYTGAVLDHTITDEVLSVNSKEIITDGVGYFSFVVPTVKGKPDPYYYDDIALHDKVKIWYGYDSVSGDPDFVGRVCDISAPLSTKTGYIRVISGLSQGEILLRRHKSNKFYTGTNASVIVEEWADDLGLGKGEIGFRTAQPDIEVRTKTYFDLLRQISDFWLSAVSLIKRDFYVDVDFNLVWKARPFRSAGVETFTVGDNILSYNVKEKVESVANNITVYGSADKPLPSDKDSWTEDSLALWTATLGNLSLDAGTKRVGAKSICCDAAAGNIVDFQLNIPRVTIRDINTLYWWGFVAAVGAGTGFIRLYAPDNANYFEETVAKGGAWAFHEMPLGPNQEYDAATNPNGIWTKTGSPNWWNIEQIQFYCDFGAAGQFYYVDGLYFYPERWSNTATDAASVTSYGQRDMEVTDDKLHSDGDCEKRGETLLYQLKDAPSQIDLTVAGNTNVLIGDRLSMTIPAEGISAVNYDVLSVEHSLSNQGFITKAVMVNSGNIRKPMKDTPIRALSSLKRKLRELAIEVREL